LILYEKCGHFPMVEAAEASAHDLAALSGHEGWGVGGSRFTRLDNGFPRGKNIAMIWNVEHPEPRAVEASG
jgi:hypothetical protein